MCIRDSTLPGLVDISSTRLRKLLGQGEGRDCLLYTSEPLREQSEKAKKYLVLRDELRGLEISVWLDTLERIRASNIKLEADYQETARQREEARTAQEKAYAAAETYSAQMREKDVEADRLRFEMQGREAQANELESAIAVLKSSIQHNLESAARLKADLEQQEGRCLLYTSRCV